MSKGILPRENTKTLLKSLASFIIQNTAFHDTIHYEIRYTSTDAV
jgi:hypothetical protein